jgi:hypothetical protein
MENTDPPPLASSECREPTLEDLAELTQALNAAGARYLVVGGFAIRAAGFIRSTMDVDLLVETGVENEAKVIEGLCVLPDQAARDIQPGDVARYGVIRVADEILVDVMQSACGVTWAEAMPDAVHRDINGVRIPFASAQSLWRMKQTSREKDIPDRQFLRRLLEAEGVEVVSSCPHAQETDDAVIRAWRRLKAWWPGARR